jgi:AcrR family transcriptional regulator
MLPPKARKQPQQSRSRLLVQSVKEACRQVLYKEGVEALTANHLAAVAGISVGSLYQYYPNLESVVAEVYDDIIKEYLQSRQPKSSANFEVHRLDVAVDGIIRRLVALHRFLLKLNREFHCRYHRCFNLERNFNEMLGQPNALIELTARTLARDGVPGTAQELEQMAFLMMRCGRALIQEALDDCPDLLLQEDFAEQLIRMCLAAAPPGYYPVQT